MFNSELEKRIDKLERQVAALVETNKIYTHSEPEVYYGQPNTICLSDAIYKILEYLKLKIVYKPENTYIVNKNDQ